ncbi:hypothetical protein ASF29_23250 [Rhizobium sp. Leaf262]|nr:hypothetical protein ASF29_23250 [Rhizobium sp. Leaf262]
MTKYFFHITYKDETALDEYGSHFSTPYRAITEAELNLLTFALEAKVRGKSVPHTVVIVEDGISRKFVAARSTEN